MKGRIHSLEKFWYSRWTRDSLCCIFSGLPDALSSTATIQIPGVQKLEL